MGGRAHVSDWERKCEVEGENCDKLAVLGKTATFKGSDEPCSAGDRIELVRFLSTLIH